MNKHILSFFVFSVVFAFGGINASFANANTDTSANTDCSFYRTLKVGLKGNDVACLQQKLGISADGKFGPKTKAAVWAWQAKWGLSTDGMFGAKSRTRWVAHGGNSGNFPEGCESASGYSRTTGKRCYAIPSKKSSEDPIISSISPTSGVLDSQVTIFGSGFTETGNKIKFGDTNSENNPKYNLKSNDIVCIKYPCPNSITFTVPSTYYVPCLETKPSCAVAERMVQPGTYKVSVINTNGTSNAVKFVVTEADAED